MVEVTAVMPLEEYWLRLTLSNGDIIERDVQDVLRGEVFERVRANRDVFEAAFVDGGTVAWPGSVDLAPETLIWDGPGPRQPDTHPEPRLRVRSVT